MIQCKYIASEESGISPHCIHMSLSPTVPPDFNF